MNMYTDALISRIVAVIIYSLGLIQFHTAQTQGDPLWAGVWFLFMVAGLATYVTAGHIDFEEPAGGEADA